LSTKERLHGIETGIVMSQYLAVSWHHDIARYILFDTNIETSILMILIEVSKVSHSTT